MRATSEYGCTIAAAAFLSLTSLVGCDKVPTPKGAEATAAPSGPVAPPFTPDEFQKLSARVDKLESEAQVRAMIADADTIAYLKPANQEFEPIRTSMGYVTVNIANVTDYANGSQIVLQFGNLTAASLNNLTAKIEWGRVDANGLPTGQTFSKDEQFTEAMPAASWKRYTLNLEGVPPKELGYVRVRNVESRSISLRPAY